MDRLICAIAVLCIFVTIPINACASHPVKTDDIGIVQTDKYEFEIGYYNSRMIDSSRSQSGDIALKYGVSEKMDVGFIVPFNIEPGEE